MAGVMRVWVAISCLLRPLRRAAVTTYTDK